MKAGYLFGFLLLMAFDTFSQISFKLAGMRAFPPATDVVWLIRLFAEPWIYGAIIGYLGAFYTWISLLKHAPIGPAFAASHLDVVSVLLLSAVLFNEHIDLPQLGGAAVVVAGICCLALAERGRPQTKT